MTQRFKSPRNYGYGKQLEFAVKNSLRCRYGAGHFSSTHTHVARFRPAATFFGEAGIKDARDIDLDLVLDYAESVAARVDREEIGLHYAQNLISTLNVVLSTMRRNNALEISPRGVLANRRRVRIERVAGIDVETVERCIASMRAAGMHRAATVAELARYGGMRLREAALANLPRLAEEGATEAKCNVVEGTKGGRNAPRWIKATPRLQLAVSNAAECLEEHRTNLLLPDETYISFVRGELFRARVLLKREGVKGYHELRAAFACMRYLEITGQLPKINGGEPVPVELDRLARITVSIELGHGRDDVSTAYLGGRK
jgi:hypothetical protein